MLPWCLGFRHCSHGLPAGVIAVPESTLPGEVSSDRAPCELNRTKLTACLRKGKLQFWPKNGLPNSVLTLILNSNVVLKLRLFVGEIWEKPKQHHSALGLREFSSLEDCIFLQPRCCVAQTVSPYLWRVSYKGNGWWGGAVGVYKLVFMELHLWDQVWC